MVLVTGFAMYVVFAPPTLLARLLRSIACAVCPSAPKGLPQARAMTRRLTAILTTQHGD